MPSIFTLSGTKRSRKSKRKRGLGSSADWRCPWGDEPASLRKVPLDRGGYDSQGIYFGVGEPVFEASNRDHRAFYRARDRKAAKKKFLERCPTMKFLR